jgi:hypothetical protein
VREGVDFDVHALPHGRATATRLTTVLILVVLI